jgi:hypothetical protein
MVSALKLLLQITLQTLESDIHSAGYVIAGAVHCGQLEPTVDTWERCIPISTAPAVEPARVERSALGL